MNKKALGLALALSITVASCASGPHQLRRTVDDWDHQMYVDNPWLNGVLWFVPVIPVVNFGASIGDFLITDAYAFWFKDAWDGKGTAFTHFEVTPTDGAMSSLMIDDSSFLSISASETTGE